MYWTRGPTIGRGSTATVSLATALSTGQLIAVKSANLNPSLLQKEQLILSQLSSPYIITCLGSDATVENSELVYNLFLEYLSGGSLSDQIRAHGGELKEDTIRSHTRQILQGLRHTHRKGFVHCDIKAQNILIEGRSKLKIADFGCAKEVGSATSAFSGTPAYMAPEVARGEEQSFGADIWALGCVVVEMATGSNPWPNEKDPVSVLYRIAYSDDVPKIPFWFSENARDFVERCLARDAKDRPSADELLKHPFIAGDFEEQQFVGKSPTSVVDWSCWDYLEVFGSCDGEGTSWSVSDRLVGRISSLVSSESCLDLTEDEGDWLTVRCGEQVEEQSCDCKEEIISQGFAAAEDVLFHFNDVIYSHYYCVGNAVGAILDYEEIVSGLRDICPDLSGSNLLLSWASVRHYNVNNPVISTFHFFFFLKIVEKIL